MFKVTAELDRSNLNQIEFVCKIYGRGHLISLKTIIYFFSHVGTFTGLP